MREPEQPFESVAVAVKTNEPTTIDVPERTPAGESEIPSGRVPFVTDQVTAPTPPVWVSVVAG